MTNPYPKIPLTRGSLSSGTQLLLACLLIFPASHMLLSAFHDGVTAKSIVGFLLCIAAMPLITRWLGNITGETFLMYCDERAMIIRERPGRQYISMLTSLKRIARDGRGYTLHLENCPQFRLLRKDATPQLRAILDAQHERLEKAFQSATGSFNTPVA